MLGKSSAHVPLCEVNQVILIFLVFVFSTEIKHDNIRHVEMCCGNSQKLKLQLLLAAIISIITELNKSETSVIFHIFELNVYIIFSLMFLETVFYSLYRDVLF